MTVQGTVIPTAGALRAGTAAFEQATDAAEELTGTGLLLPGRRCESEASYR